MKKNIFLSFDGLDIPKWNRAETIGTAAAKSGIIETPASWVDGYGRKAKDNPHERTIRCTIFGSSDQTAWSIFQSWRALRKKRGRLIQQLPNRTKQWVVARLKQINADHEYTQLSRIIEMELVFEIISESWNGLLHENWKLNDGYKLNDGNKLNQGSIFDFSAGGGVFELIYDGDDDENGMIITITASENDIPAGLTIAGNGTKIRVNTNIKAYQALVIDNGVKSVTNNGTAAYNSLEFLPGHSTDGWFVLRPESNIYAITAAAAGSIKFSYSDRWA